MTGTPGARPAAASSGTPPVDYGDHEVAAHYARGRSLAPGVLDRWRAAVDEVVPDRPHLRVLDVGAGTGIFARAWPAWRDCEVLAVEPAPAMRHELVAGGVPPGVRVLAGRAEDLPVRAGVVDVAWLSAVFHHLADRSRAVAELARVVAPGGLVLVRGLFADRSRVGALELLPGAGRVVAEFPSTVEVRAAFEEHGFEAFHEADVEDAGPATVGDAVRRVGDLRVADSLLARFTDDELAAGLEALRRRDPEERLPPTLLGLLAFRRRAQTVAGRRITNPS